MKKLLEILLFVTGTIGSLHAMDNHQRALFYAQNLKAMHDFINTPSEEHKALWKKAKKLILNEKKNNERFRNSNHRIDLNTEPILLHVRELRDATQAYISTGEIPILQTIIFHINQRTNLMHQQFTDSKQVSLLNLKAFLIAIRKRGHLITNAIHEALTPFRLRGIEIPNNETTSSLEAALIYYLDCIQRLQGDYHSDFDSAVDEHRRCNDLWNNSRALDNTLAASTKGYESDNDDEDVEIFTQQDLLQNNFYEEMAHYTDNTINRPHRPQIYQTLRL